MAVSSPGKAADVGPGEAIRLRREADAGPGFGRPRTWASLGPKSAALAQTPHIQSRRRSQVCQSVLGVFCEAIAPCYIERLKEHGSSIHVRDAVGIASIATRHFPGPPAVGRDTPTRTYFSSSIDLE
jgi:hypothetical protein